MKIKQKDVEREKAKNIMRKVLRLAYEEKFEDINNMITVNLTVLKPDL